MQALEPEIVDFTRRLIRVPTVNPPGEGYVECAELIADTLSRLGFQVRSQPAEGMPQHTARHPRVNVVGVREGPRPRPCLHLNGHMDVVPAGRDWTVDPFSGLLADGKIYGRGSADMKAGLAAAIYASAAVRRSGVPLEGRLEISATVDEESGGEAGVAWLARHGGLDSSRVDYVIIPEPLDVDRICIGHRGAYWCRVTARGRIGHGSMPFAGVNAIREMGRLLEALRQRLEPRLASRRTSLPVVPEAARRPSINVNAIRGGQPAAAADQTPCVPDRCEAVLDRRYLPEEDLDEVRDEIRQLLAELEGENPESSFGLDDVMVAAPVETPPDAPLVKSLEGAIRRVLGRPARLVASPGTYDHKHVTRIGGITQCVAYGPGRLEQAHQPDEHCSVADLLDSTRVLALTIVDLIGSRRT